MSDASQVPSADADVTDVGVLDAAAIGVDADVLDADVLDADVLDADVLDADVLDADVAEAVELAQRLESERDEYLDLARRLQADFENFRKRTESQRGEQAARAAERLVAELLPVLDAGDAAVAHGTEGAGPIHQMLVSILEKQGLTRVADVEVPFDPTVHEAVLTEPGDDEAGPVVAEVLRSGYAWNGRVVRAAMVKVRG